MKKLLCICVTTLVLIGIPVAYAAGIIDFSAYTDEELITIIEELNTELVARGIGKTATISPDTYLVGRDIPTGKYVLTNDTEDTAYYLIYKDNSQSYKDNEALDRGNLYAGKECFIVVEEGQVLTTRHQPLKLTISAGVVFE